MKTISYLPGKDELFAQFSEWKARPSKQIGHFSFWWDNKGNICAIRISEYCFELEKFKLHLNEVKLGGIWNGVRISDKDIREARKDLLKSLEEKW